MSDLLVASRLIILTASKRFVTDVFSSVDSCLLAMIFYWKTYFQPFTDYH